MKLIGYVRLSKADCKSTLSPGHSLDSQRASIHRWCEANGHELVTVIAEVGSAKTHAKLPGRLLAIASVKAGVAEAIIVRDLDRVTRSNLDGAALLEDAKAHGWRLLGASDGMDTADPEQEVITSIRIALAQEERRKLARRTKDGIAAARRSGSQIGKPRQVPVSVERRIVRLHKEGLTPYRIAKQLDRAKTPTPQGGKSWSPSVVRDVIARNTKAA